MAQQLLMWRIPPGDASFLDVTDLKLRPLLLGKAWLSLFLTSGPAQPKALTQGAIPVILGLLSN